jgi:mannose-6-phosphate isomerase-like protein (cupin superfamily)
MYVIDQPAPAAAPIPGIAHATWAGAAEGLSQLSVWRQTLAPGAATPPHSHDCDEVVLCSAGGGELHIDGAVYPFTAQQTLVIPNGRPHQIVNSGRVPLECIGLFGPSPVNVFLPDGSRLELPWRS